MSLIAIYGVNAAGKDTVANALQKNNPNIFITSEPRLLMYHLGLIPSYATNYKVERASYKQLEDTPQSVVLNLINTKYQTHLRQLKTDKETTTLLLTHLVFALNLDKKKPKYLIKKIPTWTQETFNGFINLVSPPQEIDRRRHQDENVRDRGMMEISQIAYHQRLCDEKWEELVRLLNPEVYIKINNEQLAMAISEAKNFIEKIR